MSHVDARPPESLEVLVERFRATGDTAAVGEVFDRVAPRLFGLAVTWCGDARDAEDALQETFLTAFASLDRFDSGRRIEPWLAGILRNKSAKQRARRGRPTMELREMPPALVVSASTTAERREDVARARAAIDALPEPYRSVAILRWRYGLQPAEIAEIRGEAPGTVRSTLSRGVARLRRELGSAPLALLLAGDVLPRGPGKVRDAVIARLVAASATAGGAATVAVSAGSAGAIGGAFGGAVGGAVMSKKLAFVAAIAAAALLVGLWRVADDPGARSPRETSPRVADVAADAERARTSADAVPAAAMEGAAVALVRVVRFDDDRPVAGAKVVLEAHSGPAFAAETGEDGRARVVGVERAERLTLTVGCAGYVTAVTEVAALTSADVTDLGVIRLNDAVRAVVEVRSLLDNSPLEGATVEAFVAGRALPHADRAQAAVTGPTPRHQAVTDAGGEVHFRQAFAGQWSFRASKAGFATGTTIDRASGGVEVPIATGSTEARFIIRLSPGHTVAGRVIDQFDVPLEDALVIAAPRRGVLHVFNSLRVRTDAAGRFELRGLDDGAFTFGVAPEGASAVVAQPVHVPLDGELELVVARGGVLTGIVTDSATGAPIEGARVVASGGGMFRRGECVTDADGAYRIDSLPPCTVVFFTVDADGYAMAVPALDDVELPAGVTRKPRSTQVERMVLDLPLPYGVEVRLDVALTRGATVTGVVRGPDGPVPFAEVKTISGEQSVGVSRSDVVADSTGRYTIGGLRPGRVVLRASRTGYYSPDFPRGSGWSDALAGDPEWEAVTVELAAGEFVERDLVVARGTTISGVILDPEGRPLAGAAVAWFQRDYGVGNRRAAAREDGTFAIDGALPDQPIVIWPEHAEFYAEQTVRIETPGDSRVRGVELRTVERAFVSGTIRCADGHDTAGAVVRVWSDSGRTHIEGRSVADAAAPVAVTADGTYRVAVPANADGTFQVRAELPGHRCRHGRRYPVQPGGETQVDIVLDEFEPISGVVFSAGGHPIAGARIGVGNYGQTTVAVTGTDGRFTVDDLRLDTGVAFRKFWLWAAARDHQRARVQVDDARRASMRFELTPTLTIAGRVRTQNGDPIAGAIVSARPVDGGRAFAFTAGRFEGEAVTQADGSFEIRELPDGRYQLSVRIVTGGPVGVVPDLSPTVSAGASDVDLRVLTGRGAGVSGPHAHLSTAELGRKARVAAISRRDHTSAIELWTELLDRPLTPDERATALFEVAESLRALDRTEESLETLRVILDTVERGSQHWARAATTLAEPLFSEGDEDGAFALMDVVIAETRDAPTRVARARLIRAQLLERQGDVDRALEEAEALAADLPDDPRYSGILGTLRGMLVSLRAKSR